MKSIHFCIEELKEALLNGKKTQTVRCLMIPRYLVNEVVKVNWRKRAGKKKQDLFLFFARITEIYCKKINELTDEEAARDGFATRETLIKKLMEMHRLKSGEHFCFVIRFKRVLKSKGRLEEFL